ncbi:MAG: DUF177 domain-containing protein [Eubacteriales bacterium]|nr:DUF177 domain-containing protein [Eubacteriales bacterium]
MIIKVDNLNNGFSQEIDCEGNINLPENKKAFVKIKGKITNSYGKYTVDGEVFSKIGFQCNSCLTDFEREINFPILEVFSKSEADDEEIWIFSSKDNIINLEQPIAMNILLNLPMKALCSENCKGLCRICGHNLNDGDCGCDRDFIDPRFEDFLKLFKNKEV